jgi:hypothetical protein
VASRSAILAIRIIADAAGAKKGLRDTETAAERFERGVDSASVKAAGALAAVGAGALYAARRASDLGESVNAVQKTFGPASASIAAFGRDAAKNAGLSQRAFNDLAVRTGSLLTNMGLSQQAAADQTTVLAQRAADMASVFNTDVATAMEAINSGLRGEAEPLRAFGVGLSDAAIKAHAMSMGLYGGTGALDATARAAATTDLIMAQTAKTAGDFGDTADSMANRQRTLAAETENLAAAFGEQLVPYMETLLGVGQSVLSWAGNNQTATKALVGTVAALAAGILALNAGLKAYHAAQTAAQTVTDLVTSATLRQRAATVAQTVASTAARLAAVAWTAAQRALNLALTMNPIGLVVAAIALLIAGIVLAYNKSDAFRGMVNALGRALSSVLGAAIRGVGDAFEGLVSWMRTAWDWAGRMIAKVAELAGKLNPLRALGSIIGRSAAAAPAGAPLAYTTSYARTTDTTPAAAGAAVLVTEEQVYRAVARLLARGAARNGRTVMLA